MTIEQQEFLNEDYGNFYKDAIYMLRRLDCCDDAFLAPEIKTLKRQLIQVIKKDISRKAKEVVEDGIIYKNYSPGNEDPVNGIKILPDGTCYKIFYSKSHLYSFHVDPWTPSKESQEKLKKAQEDAKTILQKEIDTVNRQSKKRVVVHKKRIAFAEIREEDYFAWYQLKKASGAKNIPIVSGPSFESRIMLCDKLSQHMDELAKELYHIPRDINRKNQDKINALCELKDTCYRKLLDARDFLGDWVKKSKGDAILKRYYNRYSDNRVFTFIEPQRFVKPDSIKQLLALLQQKAEYREDNSISKEERDTLKKKIDSCYVELSKETMTQALFDSGKNLPDYIKQVLQETNFLSKEKKERK